MTDVERMEAEFRHRCRAWLVARGRCAPEKFGMLSAKDAVDELEMLAICTLWPALEADLREHLPSVVAAQHG